MPQLSITGGRMEPSSPVFPTSQSAANLAARATIESEAARELIRSGPNDYSGIPKTKPGPCHIRKQTHQVSFLGEVLRLGLGPGRRLDAFPPPPSCRLRRRRRLRLARSTGGGLRLDRTSGGSLGRCALLTPRARHQPRLLGLGLRLAFGLSVLRWGDASVDMESRGVESTLCKFEWEREGRRGEAAQARAGSWLWPLDVRSAGAGRGKHDCRREICHRTRS